MAIEIPLSKKGNKYAGNIALVDDCDANLAEFNWSCVPYRNNTRYARRESYGRPLMMHRIILERVLDRPLLKSEFVDHINGNGLDNRRENLRLATNSQNMMNRGKTVLNKSGYKGVRWHKRDKKWVAQIVVNGHQKHIGYFDTPEEAHAAYCEKAKELHGEFWKF